MKFQATCIASICFLGIVTYSGVSPNSLPPAVLFSTQNCPFEQRVDDLISRMTLEEKGVAARPHAASIPRLHVPEYNWWNEVFMA